MEREIRRVHAQIEDWKRKLIDLSHRNRLLYFKRTSPTVLRLLDPDPIQIYTRLAVDEKAWSFYSDHESLTGETLPLADISDTQEIGSANDFSPRKRKPTEVITNLNDPQKLKKTLTNLKRRSDSDFAERGVRILQITFGLVEWRDEATSLNAYSPILLLPCQLDKPSRDRLPEISATEDELVLNPALIVKFEQDFGVKLPNLPDELDSQAILDYFQQVQTCVGVRGWKVLSEVWCGLFSFHRMDIYRDLTDNLEPAAGHPIVLALSRERALETAWTEKLQSDSELDLKVDPRDSFTIRDADSSQLGALCAISNGRSILIQGPPGTGKSQTIANCIADAIARGKRVLFVSDKMAALEVVFSRLREAGLERFVLELHSTKTKRQTVVNELHMTMTSRSEPKKWLSEQEVTRLIQKRKRLNDYVRAIGVVRNPLESSVREVLGTLASLHETPLIELPGFQAAELSAHRLYELSDVASRLSRIWEVVQEGKFHPWSNYVGHEFGKLQKEEIDRLISESDASLANLEKVAAGASDSFGQTSPEGMTACLRLLRLLDQIENCPGIRLSWLDFSNRSRVRHLSKEYQKLHSDYASRRADLRGVVTESFLAHLEITPEQLDGQIRELGPFVGGGIRQVQDSRELLDQINGTAGALAEVLESLADGFSGLSRFFNVDWKFSIDNVARLRSIVRLCSSESRPDPRWYSPRMINDIETFLPKLESLISAREPIVTTLLQLYDRQFLALPADSLLADLRTRYRGFSRWLRPGYFKIRRLIRAARSDGSVPSTLIDDLRNLSRLQALDMEISLLDSEGVLLLSSQYSGTSSDCQSVRARLGIAKDILALVNDPSRQIIDSSSSDSMPDIYLQKRADDLDHYLERLNSLTADFPPDIASYAESVLAKHEDPLTGYAEWVQSVTERATRAIYSVRIIENYLLKPEKLSLSQAAGLLNARAAILDGLREIDPISAELVELAGVRFAGPDTDWQGLDDCIAWTDQLIAIMAPEALSQKLRDQLETPYLGLKHSSELRSNLAAAKEVHESILHLSGFRELADTFTEVRSWTHKLQNRADDIHDILEARRIEIKLLEFRLPKLIERIRPPNPQPREVAAIISKAVLEHWIQWVSSHDDALLDFRREDHDQVNQEFKSLDRMQWERGVHHIVSSANRNRKLEYGTVPGGEPEILLREAFKKGRHLPLRRLFSQIPNLMAELKPCLMMSPISVSQFLDPASHGFDLVVFDEASQIRTEEAIGPIYRSKQVVICGDERQLPPTTFFEQGMLEELDEDGDLGAFDEYESILKAASTIELPNQRLRWHYRSRHETLITYSNRKFYSDRPLVTFASAIAEDESLGVKFKLVPNGIYDRGGTKKNLKEAEVVAQTVMDVLRRFPGKTVGVVAFSVSQKEAIEDSLEDLSRRESELRALLEDSENRLSGFFVKNLESVQGDERDIMIISVGYARDVHGRLTMNFGPLNRAGGERRLNVVITRARELCIVVSSISWADFGQTDELPAGARHLRDYLRYAEQGPSSFEFSTDQSDGETESPLEDSVAAEITAKGYQLHTQVGCSGYRIDIGVLSPYQPGRYILAVECDGATYHSTFVARDRDRLRQEVLEDLGWRVHRIWSVDWWKRRDREVSRLLAAIEQAEKTPGWHKAPSPIGRAADISPPLEVLDISVDGNYSRPRWAKYYSVTDLRGHKAPHPFHDERSRELIAKLLRKVIENESPIHLELATRRIAGVWRHVRVTGLMIEAVREILTHPEHRSRTKLLKDTFLISESEDQISPRVPQEGIEGSYRDIDHIPKGEISSAIEYAVNDAFTISHDDLYKYIAKLFGFERTGSQIRSRLAAAAAELVGSERIASSDAVFHSIK